jgi:hypothetical protein
MAGSGARVVRRGNSNRDAWSRIAGSNGNCDAHGVRRGATAWVAAARTRTACGGVTAGVAAIENAKLRAAGMPAGVDAGIWKNARLVVIQQRAATIRTCSILFS